MKEKNAIFINDILKNTINVYFDTFFVFYFFTVANYEIIPLAKYYLTLYLFTGIGFFFIRGAMKKNVKIPYFRIGISLQALYIALIMLMKGEMVHHIYFIGIVKGVADGFYHFPKNLMNTEKVQNKDRQKYDGMVITIKKIVSITIPLLLGVLLTYFSYTDIGKVFFLLFIVMFVLSFHLKDQFYVTEKMDMKGFFHQVGENKKLKKSLCLPLLSGLTHSSGVMGLIITLSKIYNFETNLNLGFVDSFCAALSLVVVIFFTMTLKEKQFKPVLLISGIISFLTMIGFAFHPSKILLIAYLIIRHSCITLISMISALVAANLSNSEDLKSEYKAEFYLVRDLLYSVSRCFGYGLLFLVCIIFGMQYADYLMILCAFAIFIEAITVTKLIHK